MSGLIDLKITEFDKKISELATRPNATTGLTDAQVKAWWDSSPEELRVKLNLLIDGLLAITAAAEIGITSPHGANIQAVLEYIIAQGSGSMPGANSVGTEAIQDASITLAKMGFDISTQTELDSAISSLTSLINGLAGTGRTTETVKGAYDLSTVNVPAGLVSYFAMSTAPTGYLKANGAAVSRTTYASLFTAIGTIYGVGDGSTTFNLPDLRGVFPRGWDDSRGYDTGRVFGSYQADDNKAHTHTGTTSSNGNHAHTYSWYNNSSGATDLPQSTGSGTTTSTANTSSAGAHDHTFTTDSTGATEVKVKNVALLACVKY